jgi:glutamate/aspartate transport system permease protein
MLDFSVFTPEVFQAYILNGLYFSLALTLVATIGGIVFGTVLALLRLSGIKPLELVAATYVNGMRSIPLLMVLLWFFLMVPFIWCCCGSS